MDRYETIMAKKVLDRIEAERKTRLLERDFYNFFKL
jgi:hypothetical protein